MGAIDKLWDLYSAGLVYAILISLAGLRLLHQSMFGKRWILGGTMQAPRWMFAAGGLLAQIPTISFIWLGLKTAEEAAKVGGG
ncbi:MAG: hypothetical protein AB8G23_24080 [Myxococcota bacterium]